jgi:splicing factor 3B subunit 4
MTKLYSKPLRVTKASSDRTHVDVGANLFIGNLAPEVDEKVLYDTFSAFGVMVMPPKVMRDPESGVPKGFGFVNYDSFEASDMAIECMSGQFLGSRQVVVQYALKRDVPGERHGGMAERLLAASRPGAGSSAGRPHTLFAAAPGQVSSIVPATSMIGQGGGYGSAPPQMLPPAAILPASMAPPPLPPPQAPYPGPPPIPGPPPLPPAFAQPPPLPSHMMYGGGPPPLGGGFLPPLPPAFGAPPMMGMYPPMLPPPPLPPGMMMPPPLPFPPAM